MVMERYRLADLVRLTGLTPRTIRFYIAEGLLPPPEGAGPAAVYGAGHRDRLRLIGALKDHYLPLREIRRRLATLTDAEVREQVRLLGEAGREPAFTVPPPLGAAAGGGVGEKASGAAPDGGVAESAAGYLDRVLGRTAGVPAAPEAPRVPAPAPLPAVPPLDPVVRFPGAPPGSGGAEPSRERWERVVLAEGVELHVREDRRRETGPLGAIIRQARKLLGEG